MMRIDIATLFPEMCEAVLSTSIIGRARKAGKVEIYCHNIRDYSPDPKHHRVDDTPYGGGKGMVMQPEPIYRCYLDIIRQSQSIPHVIYLSPQGSVLTLIPLSSHHLIARSPLAPLLLRQVLQTQQRRVFVGAWPQRTGCLTVQQTLG